MPITKNMKEKIIISAIECFYRQGFLETTFQQIAAKAKISQPHIYNHFKNKMDLILECSKYASEIGRQFIDSSVDERKPAQERLNQYIEANLRWFLKERAYGFCIISVYYFAQTHKEMRSAFAQLVESGIGRLEILLYQYQNESRVPLSNINTTAKIIHDILIGEIYKIALWDSKKNKQLNETLNTDILAAIHKLLSP